MGMDGRGDGDGHGRGGDVMYELYWDTYTYGCSSAVPDRSSSNEVIFRLPIPNETSPNYSLPHYQYRVAQPLQQHQTALEPDQTKAHYCAPIIHTSRLAASYSLPYAFPPYVLSSRLPITSPAPACSLRQEAPPDTAPSAVSR
jgi:hypothetical protein